VAQRYAGQFRSRYSHLHRDRDLRWVVPLRLRYVVGITGERFAGKSVALTHFGEKHNFEVYSLSAMLRELAVERGVPLEPRERLQDLGDEMRAEYRDPALLARLTLRRIHHDHLDTRGEAGAPKRIVVASFKRPEEVRLFESLGRFVQVNVTAPRPARLARARRSGIMQKELRHLPVVPELNMATFISEIDRRDLDGDANPWTRGFGQAVSQLALPSALELRNDGMVADLCSKIDDVVRRLNDEYPAFSG
jgi:dephospho-CoA kinase